MNFVVLGALRPVLVANGESKHLFRSHPSQYINPAYASVQVFDGPAGEVRLAGSVLRRLATCPHLALFRQLAYDANLLISLHPVAISLRALHGDVRPQIRGWFHLLARSPWTGALANVPSCVYITPHQVARPCIPQSQCRPSYTSPRHRAGIRFVSSLIQSRV